MTSVKDKLLALVGDTNIDDMQTSRLVDLLADKIKKLEYDLKQEEGRRAQIALDLRNERESFHRERQEMRKDPTYWMAGHYGFMDGKARYIVQIRGGRVELMEMKDGNMILIANVPAEQVYAA